MMFAAARRATCMLSTLRASSNYVHPRFEEIQRFIIAQSDPLKNKILFARTLKAAVVK